MKNLKVLALCFVLQIIALPLFGQSSLYYDRTTNGGWFASNMWGTVSGGPYNTTTWSDGNIATFEAGTAITVSINNNIALAGLVNTGSNVDFAGSGTRLMTFNGGTISGAFTFGGSIGITGNATQTSGTISWGGSGYAAYAGTYSLTGGRLTIGQSTRVTTASNFTVAGGTLDMELNTSTPSIGALIVNSGSVRWGRSTGSFEPVTAVTSLSGTGGTIGNRGNSDASNPTTMMVVNQSTNTTFSGTINGSVNGGNDRFALTKSGSGDLTLSGTISNMQRTTTIDGGRLYINGASAHTFGDTLATTAIQVSSGGTLGGTGTITTTAGDNVIVASGGKLAAGLVGTAGRTTYALGTGATLDISSIATGALLFDLGANTTAGTTYDQITLSSGTFAIGSGVLNFDDFAFTALSGFGQPAVYTLFSTTGISGTLGSFLSGTVNGYNSTLSISGNNLLLTVVPEPSTISMCLFGAGALVLLGRRRLRKMR